MPVPVPLTQGGPRAGFLARHVRASIWSCSLLSRRVAPTAQSCFATRTARDCFRPPTQHFTLPVPAPLCTAVAALQAVYGHALRFQSIWDQAVLPDPPPQAAAAPTSGANGSGSAPAAAGAGFASTNGRGMLPTAAAGLAGAGAASQPEFSTWKFRSKGESRRVIDYIWFSGGGQLRPLQRWRMPTQEEIGPCALPSASYASDHISMCAEFEWDLPHLEWAPAADDPEWG
jgi:hypothetical protein